MKPNLRILNSAENSALILMSAKDLQAAGFTRAVVYQLLNRADMPVVTFGRRKFMLRDKFLARLDEMTERKVS